MLVFLLIFVFPGVSFAYDNYANYVDPFIGTGGHGHTFPGAVVPFGMVQLSPDTGSGRDGIGARDITILITQLWGSAIPISVAQVQQIMER